MVEGFSEIQALLFCFSARRDFFQFSVSAFIVALLLMHSAHAHQAASMAASQAQDRSTMLRMRRSNINDLYKPSYGQSNVQSRKLANDPNRRQILVIKTYALASAGGADHVERALVGSSPPSCIKKCGKCIPCKSVLVPVHTNNFPATPEEYYPEAWQCQCKGKIYNP